ncbi:MAG: glycosyltransferase family 4 protein [Actinobacteria bacterium]|nr:MAG: glycosyltransferase family 4 protein [Actinomycetota bacterium]
MRILLVSQMYPGPEDPDLGVFVAQLERALRERGHEVELAVLDRRGGKRRFATLLERTLVAAGRFRPDVVYAHFLVPAGTIASLVPRVPLVVTAHGRDVRNVGTLPGIGTLTRRTSDYLRRELEAKVPEARGKTEVIDSGVDLERFRVEPAPNGEPSFLCLGALTERKNPVRLAEAFERLGRGSLTFVGDGPLRPRLEGRPGVQLAGSVPHDEIPAQIAQARVVCQPSLIEPFGQALLEAMACGRPVVATRIGGPPEFVPPEAGVLVDPLDVGALSAALATAAELPCPSPEARAAAEQHDVTVQAARVEAVLERAARSR